MKNLSRFNFTLAVCNTGSFCAPDLLQGVISSFDAPGKSGIGLPLGNLTSQLLVNIYMNEFDQFVKHSLKEKYYIRYADDFVCLSENRAYLERLVEKIAEFLEQRLGLALHPDKIFLSTRRY